MLRESAVVIRYEMVLQSEMPSKAPVANAQLKTVVEHQAFPN